MRVRFERAETDLEGRFDLLSRLAYGLGGAAVGLIPFLVDALEGQLVGARLVFLGLAVVGLALSMLTLHRAFGTLQRRAARRWRSQGRGASRLRRAA